MLPKGEAFKKKKKKIPRNITGRAPDHSFRTCHCFISCQQLLKSEVSQIKVKS